MLIFLLPFTAFFTPNMFLCCNHWLGLVYFSFNCNKDLWKFLLGEPHNGKKAKTKTKKNKYKTEKIKLKRISSYPTTQSHYFLKWKTLRFEISVVFFPQLLLLLLKNTGDTGRKNNLYCFLASVDIVLLQIIHCILARNTKNKTKQNKKWTEQKKE